MRIHFVIPLIYILYTLEGCFNYSWQEDKRRKFKIECSQTETFSNIVFLLKGFDNKEFDSVWVKECKDNILLDSFRIYISPSQNSYDQERKIRSVNIVRTMNVNYQYYFFFPGQKFYELSNMKMIPWAQYTMASEGWGCRMGDFTIDGIRFENCANPTFIKRYE